MKGPRGARAFFGPPQRRLGVLESEEPNLRADRAYAAELARQHRAMERAAPGDERFRVELKLPWGLVKRICAKSTREGEDLRTIIIKSLEETQ